MNPLVRTSSPDGGFSLLEVLAAATMLLLTVAAVTFCVASVSRQGRGVEAAMDADRAVRAVAQRLRSLPYCAAAYPRASAATGLAASDLVAAVFPHADPARNSPAARYVAVAGPDAPAGSFVSLLEERGVRIRCVAVFLASADGSPVAPADVEGWDPGLGAPPAPALSVCLSAADRPKTPTVRLVRAAAAALALPAEVP